MHVSDAIDRRRAYRMISPQPLSEDDIHELLEAIRLAPSCFNHQPWRVTVAMGEDLSKVKEGLSRGNAWATTAPAIMAVAAKPADDCRLGDGRDYYLFSTGLAIGQMLLRATELGIVAHPIAGYKPSAVKEALGIPNDHVLITLVILGRHGDDDSLLSDEQRERERTRPERKPPEENFFRERWGYPWS